jgi:hypothetical protein
VRSVLLWFCCEEILLGVLVEPRPSCLSLVDASKVALEPFGGADPASAVVFIVIPELSGERGMSWERPVDGATISELFDELSVDGLPRMVVSRLTTILGSS